MWNLSNPRRLDLLNMMIFSSPGRKASEVKVLAVALGAALGSVVSAAHVCVWEPPTQNSPVFPAASIGAVAWASFARGFTGDLHQRVCTAGADTDSPAWVPIALGLPCLQLLLLWDPRAGPAVTVLCAPG